MRTKQMAGLVGLVSALALLAACRELIGDPSFDRWCGDILCNWELDAGRIARTQTWHARDYAVDFVERGTQISQLSELPEQYPSDCLRFDLIADAESSARLSLELDFNDDGTVDFTRPIPGVRWERLSFDIYAPYTYDKLRFILHKAGEGKAVVAQLRARHGDSCTGERVKLSGQNAGAACTSSSVCASGLCSEGHCAECRDADCGEPCGEDSECTSELCCEGMCADGSRGSCD